MTLKIKRIIFNTNTIICLLNSVFLLFLTVNNKALQTVSTYTLLAIMTVTLISIIFLQLFYKKSLSTQILFLSVFITSLSMQGLRIIEPVINFDSFLITVQISRISIFCKYLGLLSLLGASLFSNSIKKQKIGSWLILSILASVTISSIIHFNTGIVGKNLIAKIIYGKEELILSIFIAVITVLTFVKTGFDTKNREYFILGIASFLLILGLILTFTTLTILSGIFIIILLVSGLITFMKSVHNITLWG